METKKILGLDLGTNSIGAALLNLPRNFEDYSKAGKIEWLTSRIIPLDGDYLQKFESGAQVKTKAAARRMKRGSRRLKHRYKLRRSRLIKVFKTLGWLNSDFPIDDNKKIKRILSEEGKFNFRVSDYLPFSKETILEFYNEFGFSEIPEKKKRFPEDWIIYFLRKKALTQKIEINELVRIIYMMNQRRGFKSSRKDLKEVSILPYPEFESKKKEIDHFINENFETQFVSITKVTKVEEIEEGGRNNKKRFKIYLEDSRIVPYEEDRTSKPEWEGKEFTFLVTQKLEKGKFKQNKPSIPGENDWTLCTIALSEKMGSSHPGSFFFDELIKAYKEKRNYKIRQYPVYRSKYQKELESIWKKQCELNPELSKINSDKLMLKKIAEQLYPTQNKINGAKIKELTSNDLLHLLSEDIIYYQRELKSQKALKSECKHEKRKGIDGELYGLKCIPKSSPLFQEFRIWQDIHNIQLIKKEEIINDKIQLDINVTSNYINENVKENLFELFNSKESISEADILKLIKENNPQNDIILGKKGSESTHRINLFANRENLKGNETVSRYRKVFEKYAFNGNEILNNYNKLYRLWHADYSISSSDEKLAEKGILSALGWEKKNGNYIKNNNWKIFELPFDICQAITKLPEIKKEYGSFSAYAIKKLLTVMRCGKYWNENEVNETHKSEAENIFNRLKDINQDSTYLFEVTDDDIKKSVLKSFIEKTNLIEFIKGLNTYQAEYLIYGKYSEKEIADIKTPEEFTTYIQKQIPINSLRNPVVEGVIRETMLLVRDVWKKFGPIDEIHIELARELKSNSKEREKRAKTQKENFEEKLKIKQILKELLNDNFEHYNENGEKINSSFTIRPNPENPIDIEKFKLWKELSGKNDEEFDRKAKEEKISTEFQIKKYILWLSQNCRSPYTGKIIPLSKLFDSSLYELEHIIPRAKLKNDGLNNLIISEWGVNKAKGHKLAANFIMEAHGKCKYGNTEYSLFTYDEYIDNCKTIFKFQKNKLKNLLALEPPENFIERQLNDTRYIGRKISELLKPVVKDQNGIIFTGGAITSELKANWGLYQIWKDLVRPRFERLENLLNKKLIYIDENDSNKYHFDLSINNKLDEEGIKRIDHRHHALDAIIVAATTHEHIRYLNTLNAADTDEERKKYFYSLCKGKIRDYKQPWGNFTRDVKEKLMECVISFKETKPIITKPYNKIKKWMNKDGKWKKEKIQQSDNPKWMAIRRSMFKENPFGSVFIKEIYNENPLNAIEIHMNRMLVQNTPLMSTASYIYDKEARKIIKDLIEKIGIPITERNTLMNEIKKHLKKYPLTDAIGKEYKTIQVAKFIEYAGKRVSLDKTFNHKKIDKIPYTKVGKSTLGKLLHQHLDQYKEKGRTNPSLAFSSEGLEALSKKIGTPITKVTIIEKPKDPEEKKFQGRFVETDSGSNAYFVMYENVKTGQRLVDKKATIPIHKAIESITKNKPIAEVREGYKTIILQPGDLVYVPTQEEKIKMENGIHNTFAIDWNNQKNIANRIYQVRKFSGNQCYFLKNNIASLILPYSNNENKELAEEESDEILEEKQNSKAGEFGSQNLSEYSIDNIKIREVCIKLKIDRLGNVQPVLS